MVTKFASRRDIDLITQKQDQKFALLTVEKYCKWYSIYMINPSTSEDVSIRVLTEAEYDLIEDNVWYDHVIIPSAFIDLCIKMNAKCDLETYNAICARFMSDNLSLDGIFGSSECINDLIVTYASEIKMGNIEIISSMFPSTEKLQYVLLEEDLVVLY